MQTHSRRVEGPSSQPVCLIYLQVGGCLSGSAAGTWSTVPTGLLAPVRGASCVPYGPSCGEHSVVPARASPFREEPRNAARNPEPDWPESNTAWPTRWPAHGILAWGCPYMALRRDALCAVMGWGREALCTVTARERAGTTPCEGCIPGPVFQGFSVELSAVLIQVTNERRGQCIGAASPR